jgi:hypothetical protein
VTLLVVYLHDGTVYKYVSHRELGKLLRREPDHDGPGVVCAGGTWNAAGTRNWTSGRLRYLDKMSIAHVRELDPDFEPEAATVDRTVGFGGQFVPETA